MRDIVYLLVFEGFADYEVALAATEIRRPGSYRLQTVGLDTRPVRAMSGLRVQPDLTVDAIDVERAALALVPGGHLWERDGGRRFADALAALHAYGAPVAGIGAGVLALARAGLLDRRRHTGNRPGYLDLHAPGYAGAEQYDPTVLAVSDEGVTSASGVAAVDFAHEVIRTLDLYDAQDAGHWYRLFRHALTPPWLASAANEAEAA